MNPSILSVGIQRNPSILVAEPVPNRHNQLILKHEKIVAHADEKNRNVLFFISHLSASLTTDTYPAAEPTIAGSNSENRRLQWVNSTQAT